MRQIITCDELEIGSLSLPLPCSYSRFAFQNHNTHSSTHAHSRLFDLIQFHPRPTVHVSSCFIANVIALSSATDASIYLVESAPSTGHVTQVPGQACPTACLVSFLLTRSQSTRNPEIERKRKSRIWDRILNCLIELLVLQNQ